MKKPGLLCLLAVALPLTVSAKEMKKLQPAPADKAVVYIGKLNAFNAAAPIHFFADDQYVARAKGQTYVRLELQPGDHVFWISMMERRTFVKANLAAGHSYALNAKGYAELYPITRDSLAWKEFVKTITESKPLVFTQAEVDEWRNGQPNYIEKALAEWKAAGTPALKLKADEYVDD